jgi:hypothetical protein
MTESSGSERRDGASSLHPHVRRDHGRHRVAGYDIARNRGKTIWALVYRHLGALPDDKAAMLYSLSAMTSYGHANLFLQINWQMMGALESLNGMLLFGLTTAFLFAMIQKVWPLGH